MEKSDAPFHISPSFLLEEFGADPHGLLLIPFLAGWVLVYIHCYRTGGIEAFARSSSVHQAHAIIVCALSAISLYRDDDEKFSESIPILFSTSYFVMDFVDCLIRIDGMFLVHAMTALALGCCAYVSGPFRVVRLMSRGYMVEMSNIQLHRWKRTKTRKDFAILVAVFTATRIIYLPAFILREVADIIGMRTVVFGILLLLQCLQIGWWVKMVDMLLCYKTKVGKMEDTLYSTESAQEKKKL
mmetsp:Transcript_3306/g.9495  ORF Transcript_3306/g.9495 Transcript_3306/m.9495 type:complete len:242 (+) Transcript_3306:34-759(+)